MVEANLMLTTFWGVVLVLVGHAVRRYNPKHYDHHHHHRR